MQISISNAIGGGGGAKGGGTAPFENTKSILLDGVDDEVSMDFTSTSTTGSISVWIKPTDYTTGSQIVWLYVGSGYRDLITLSQRNDGTLAFSAFDSGSSRWRVVTDNAVVSNGAWAHVVFSFDGSNGTIYINGSTVPQTYEVTTNKSWWWDDLLPTKQRLGIFRVNGYSAQQRYNGNIEEQSVFTSALSSSEVSAIYNNGLPTDLTSKSNILAWYRCGDGDTAPILTDNIGSNNGTMVNFSTFSTDVPGSFTNTKSVRFDGVDDYIRISDADNLSFGDGSTDSPFSISAWANFTDISSGGIFAKLNTSSRREYGFYISSSKVRFLLYSQGTNTKYIGRRNNTALTSYENQWIHLLATYDGSSLHSGLKIYLNGTRIDDTDVSQGSYIAMQNDAADAFIGRHLTSYTEGAMDEVAIFSSELSASDVTAIYNSGLPTDLSSYSSLVSWWRMGDGDTFPTLTDNGSGGNNGTMTNMTSGNIVSDVPGSFTNTKSVRFDGIDDRVEINNTLGSGYAEISISTWVKYNNNVATSNQYHPIVAKIGPSFGHSFQLANMRSGASSNGGELYFNVQTPNGSFTAFSGVVPSQNVWYNIVGTYDGSNVKIYIDGVLKGTLSASGNINSNTEPLMLGDAGYGGYSQFLNGNLDEVSIYSRGLTQSEVTSIYNGGAPNDVSSISNIEAWWRMGDGDTFPTLTDNIGSNNGTMTNMTSGNIVSDVPT